MSLHQKIQEIMAQSVHESTNVTEDKLLNALNNITREAQTGLAIKSLVTRALDDFLAGYIEREEYTKFSKMKFVPLSVLVGEKKP